MTPASRARLLALSGLVGVAALMWALTRPDAQGPPPDARLTADLPPPAAPASAAIPLPPAHFAPPVTKLARRDGTAAPFVERAYDPPLVLPTLAAPPPPEALTSPEATMASHVSAMAHGDLDWWLASWDEPARRALSEQLQERPGTRAWGTKQRLEAFRRRYAGQAIVLTRRIDLPGYVILYKRRADEPDHAYGALVPAALKQLPDGRWLLTHELRRHPVYGYETVRNETQVEVVTSAGGAP